MKRREKRGVTVRKREMGLRGGRRKVAGSSTGLLRLIADFHRQEENGRAAVGMPYGGGCRPQGKRDEAAQLGKRSGIEKELDHYGRVGKEENRFTGRV